MGQKVSPIGFRTGITKDWKSRWFAPKSNYGEFLVEDEKIRRFIDSRLNRQPPYAAVASVEIERTREEVKVILRTARPGLVPHTLDVDAQLRGPRCEILPYPALIRHVHGTCGPALTCDRDRLGEPEDLPIVVQEPVRDDRHVINSVAQEESGCTASVHHPARRG